MFSISSSVQTPKNSSLIVRNEKEEQQILIFKKLADNIDCFALKITEIWQKQVHQSSIS